MRTSGQRLVGHRLQQCLLYIAQSGPWLVASESRVFVFATTQSAECSTNALAFANTYLIPRLPCDQSS